MYAFTVGFKGGDTIPVLLYGPETPVGKQDEDLDRAARLDDGGDYATVEIVYSNGRPKRRVDFTTPEQKAAINAHKAEAQAAKEAEAKAQKEARIAALRIELAELEPAAPEQAESDPDIGAVKETEPMTAAEIIAAAVPAGAEIIAAEVAALSADIEAAEADADALAENPDPDSAAPPVSGKRKK